MDGQQSYFGQNRRSTDRFPIESELHYRALGPVRSAETGSGRTLNMSSGGILFTADALLPLGQRVEVAVDWPAQLNANCGLKLVAVGRVVRREAETAAMNIEKYDFRTRAAKPAAAAAGSAL